MKTIIQSLGPEDRLALVAYDDVARRDLVLTKMDDAGKEAAMKAIGTLNLSLDNPQTPCAPKGLPTSGEDWKMDWN